MTKSGTYWIKVLEFRKQRDFEGFCQWAERDATHLYEEWKIAGLIEAMELPAQKMPRLSTDSLRPLLRNKDPSLVQKTLQKIRFYLLSGKYLTRSKTLEFLREASNTNQQKLLVTPKPHEEISL